MGTEGITTLDRWWGVLGRTQGLPGPAPGAGGYTYRDRVHGLEVAPELLSGLNEQALDGGLLGTQVIYLETKRGRERPSDPMSSQARHLSGHHSALLQAFP